MNISSIGTVQSCYPDKFGTPRQPGLAPSSRAFLKLNPEVQPELSLEGVEHFSHLWVIFEFHKNTTARFHAKVHPPRLDGENIGVFATRSPHRPNAIGLSLVQIEKVERDGVWVTGIDLIDGTPILDIKPYLPAVEAKPDAKAGWAEKPVPNIKVHWTKDALEFLASPTSLLGVGVDEIKNLIEETIQTDPRPVIYRGMPGEESPYRQSHAFYIYDLDVHFTFVTDTEARVDKIFSVKK
jgi:tRNA (adenine37-N6)-methyltransferase